MKKMLTLAVIAVVLLGAGHVFASEVTNVELSYADGSTVARINVEGGIRFTHQTEEAKDGKPFRVILDILTATHKLGSNNFTSLPDCPVKSIRTSQYSVKPEAVVRVVFDMEGEQVYRVDSGDKWVTLYFADKAKRQFSAWSTAGVISAAKASKSVPAAKPQKTEKPKVASAPEKKIEKSASELNKSIKTDRLASLEPNATKTKKPSPAKKETKVAQAPKSTAKVTEGDALYGPFADKPEAVKPEKKVVAKKETVPAQSEQVAKVSDQPAKKSSVPATKQLTQAKPEQKPAQKKAVAKPVVAQKKVTQPASIASVKEDKVSKKSTSRFRRSPAQSKKIKGTLVAEFPKRLVIKYKATGRRDPFATLIDESKTYDSPVERQVPNVEGLKLVGVIEAGAKDNRALFEDKEGYGYILKTGDKVQKGYVLRVEADRVYFQIFEYGWSRTVALYLES